ncbi:MAG TPA: glycosyltransferase family 9 protein [Gemmatimonadaceae bacterium]|nr:glycosyltransferase family 9 protein [Gemmatimonadaceae bacterium]
MQLKSLERLGKRLATRIIQALMPNEARGERPDWRERRYRVLFLRHDRIGDMILSTGIVRTIAEAFPNIELDVLASPVNAPVLRNESYVHDVLVVNTKKPLSYPRTFRELRRRRYDAVIDCMVTAPSFTTLLLMLASGARYRIGVAGRGNEFAYTLPVPPRETATHLVDQLGALVTAFGLQPAAVDLKPRVRLTAEERERGERLWRGATDDRGPIGPRLLVNVSAGRAHHAWPDDRFVAVIRAVRERATDAEVVVVSSPGDRARARTIAAAAGARLVEDRGIRDAMSLVAAADLVFTPDTSIGHASSAFDKTAVVLHPRGNAAAWGPYGTNGRAIESRTADVAGITAEEASAVVLARFASRSAR